MAKLDRVEERGGVAAFMRDRRARTRPEDVGLPAGSRRRTPGLRREEVAQLAGVGITWYTWFEQGRDIKVSEDFLERLCRAFRLDAVERSHLFMLARHRLPPVTPSRPAEVSDTVRAVLKSLPCPAYIKTTRWDVVAWNEPAAEIFSDFERHGPGERNLVWLVFTSPAFRSLMVDWEGDARRTLAKFRLDHARANGDPAFETLVADLRSCSPEFRQWWSDQDVRSVGEGVKSIRHPRQGPVAYNHAAFAVEGTPDLRLIVYLPG
jgi:transcriptional regulator with XRE-family HTH domain